MDYLRIRLGLRIRSLLKSLTCVCPCYLPLSQQFVGEDFWEPLVFNNGVTKISHMAFANDIVIFGVASIGNITNMLKVVEDFCWFSSQRINFQKSQLFV